MSRNVISPINLLLLSIIGSFSILLFCKIDSASFNVNSFEPVIKFSEDITLLSFLFMSFSKRKSRFVTIPINFPALSIIGIPPMLYSLMQFNASLTVSSLERVIGSKIIPDSDLLTFLTLLL